MIEEDFVIEACYIPLKEHLKILKKIKNKYKIDTGLDLVNFENLQIQYRVSPKSKDFGYICKRNDDFYKIEYNIKKFINWKSFLNKGLTMETE